MGISLLKRSTRKVVPTQAGVRLFERFERVNSEIDDIFTEIQNLGNDDRGIIRIASTPLFARDFLGKIVGEYLQQYPHVSFPSPLFPAVPYLLFPAAALPPPYCPATPPPKLFFSFPLGN